MEFENCKHLGTQNGLNIYIPEKTVVFSHKTEKIKILHVGHRNNLPRKNMLLIGETGSGKTTMLQALYNIFRGVNFKDDYRMKLFEEEEDCSAKGAYESQTEHITGYLFYAQPFMKNRNFNLMVIDSPGLYDTRGTGKRESLMKQMTEFLKDEEHGVDDLSCIGYVVKADLTRGLEYFKEIIQDSLKLFGKDTDPITFIMKTFNSKAVRKVKEIFEDWGLSTENEYDFDNGVLFAPNKEGVVDQHGNVSTEDDLDMHTITWKRLSKNYEDFFTRLFEVRPVCMGLTRKVMQEKIYLERNKKNLIEQIRSTLLSLVAANKNQNMFKEFEECMDANKNWEGEEIVESRERIDVNSISSWYMISPHVHNCKECDRTCSDICHWLTFTPCPEMKPSCSICGCTASDHTDSKSKINIHITTRKVTKEDMKAKFDHAKNLKDQLRCNIDEMDKEVEKAKRNIARMIKFVVLETERLNEICRGNYYQTAEELTQELIDRTVKNDPNFLSYMGGDSGSFLTSLKDEVKKIKINKDTWKTELEEAIKEMDERESKFKAISSTIKNLKMLPLSTIKNLKMLPLALCK